MERLIYSSRWAERVEADVNETIRRIVSVSISNNRLANLTGLLFARDGWFIQVLEGPRGAIANAMDRIEHDPRHSDVRVLAAGPARGRLFHDWNMTAANPENAPGPLLACMGMTGGFNPSRLDAAQALDMMIALADQERARERAALGLDAA